ncbi:ABC transporter ATP-binding protein [Humidisolicoccus flavus]|uniref:ABC transporter ATP-binding protein n=1 Tax=Humidisolicoccus flavus TaxID=3111414 RepID=UPI00324E1F8E
METKTSAPLTNERASAPQISIQDLGKIFHTKSGSVEALQRVNLDIAEGEFVSIVGPSGCGKTTLLRILAGLDHATSGLVEMKSAEKQQVGMVFQHSVLLPWRTVLANVLLPIELNHRPTAKERESAIALLGKVGLADFTDKYPNELSGGMQQRVAICRALIHDPKVLLMDEPFGALDAMTRDALNLETNRIWRETQKTALLITHSIQEAVFLSERVIVMGPRPGRILDVIDIPFAKERTLALLGDPQFAQISAHIRTFFEHSEES